jgi:hypothetical protein
MVDDILVHSFSLSITKKIKRLKGSMQLELKGLPVQEDARVQDPKFLMEVSCTCSTMHLVSIGQCIHQYNDLATLH